MEFQRSERIVKACRKAWSMAGHGKVLLGLSGGADSTALLLAFTKAGVPVEAAHCNFNLRGEESLRDREFVRELCSALGVRLHIAEFNVGAEAFKGESIEMTCRRLRYDFFRRLREERGFHRIAIAHNADDNAETFFLNALRGSGSRGLMGMASDNGELIRPMLEFRRIEILDFLERCGQTYVTDSSNLKSDEYKRNFLRNEVFPMLESRWEGFHKAITSTIEIQRRENAIVEHYISLALNGATDMLCWETLDDFPDAETLIFNFIRPYGGTNVIAREMATSAGRRIVGKSWRLVEDITARFSRRGIEIIRGDEGEWLPNSGRYEWEKLKIEGMDMDVIRRAPLSEAFFPFGEEHYEWRRITREMKMKSLGMRGSQQIWKILKDSGLSPAQREKTEVLVDKETGEPVWLPGLKRSRLHLIADTAQAIYHVGRRD